MIIKKTINEEFTCNLKPKDYIFNYESRGKFINKNKITFQSQHNTYHDFTIQPIVWCAVLQ